MHAIGMAVDWTPRRPAQISSQQGVGMDTYLLIILGGHGNGIQWERVCILEPTKVISTVALE